MGQIFYGQEFMSNPACSLPIKCIKIALPSNNCVKGLETYIQTTQLTIWRCKIGFRQHKQNSVNFCNTTVAFGPNNLDSNLDRRGWLVLLGTYFKFCDTGFSVSLYKRCYTVASFDILS